jgi:hypothetical protein
MLAYKSDLKCCDELGYSAQVVHLPWNNQISIEIVSFLINKFD